MKLAFEEGVVTTDHGLEWRHPYSIDPYGMVIWDTDSGRKRCRAHRVAWILKYGHIPNGYEIDHQPDCPKTCVTIEHLQLLTKSEHTKLGWERGELNGGWGTARQRIHPPRPESFIWKSERLCKLCSAPFIPTTARKIYCSEKCMIKVKEDNRAKKRYPRPELKICPQCTIEFRPKRIDTVFCSRKCIDNNRNKNHKSYKYSKICAWCKKEFMAVADRVECCSRSCATYKKHEDGKMRSIETIEKTYKEPKYDLSWLPKVRS